MRAMSSLEYAAVVQELQPLLGRRFGRMRRLPGGIYRMKIGDAEIIIEPGIRLHRTKYMEETETQDQLAQKADSELENAKLSSVRQVNDDRIVEFGFEARKAESGSAKIVFEMFGKGNVVFVENGVALAAMKEESWADREIRKGRAYGYPKSNNLKTLREALSDRYVIIALLKLPLGKEYAQEILSRCGIPEKTPGTELTAKQVERIESEIAAVRGAQKPLVFYESGKPVDYGLAPFARYGQSESKPFGSMNEALDEFYWSAEHEVRNPELEKLERRLDEQEKRMADLINEEALHKAHGDYIYANYEAIERLLKEARAMPLDELEKRLAALKPKVDKKEKSIEIETDQ